MADSKRKYDKEILEQVNLMPKLPGCYKYYDKNNEIISTEYIELENLEVGQTKTYELKFKSNNVDRVYIIVTDFKNK